MQIVFMVVVLGLAAYGLLLWRNVVSGKSRPPLTTHQTPFGLLDVLILFVAWLMIPGIIVAALFAAWGVADTDALASNQVLLLMVLTAVTQLTTCAIAIGIFRIRYGSLRNVLGVDFRAAGLFVHFKIAFKFFAMVVPALLGLQWLLSFLIPYEHGTLDQLADNFSVNTVLVTWLGAVVAAPLCEELFFRGVLQGWLQRIRFDTAPGRNNMLDIVGGWEGKVDEENESQEHLPSNIEFDNDNPYATPGAVIASQPVKPIKADSKNAGEHPIVWWLPIVASSSLFAAVHIGQGLAPVTLFIFGLALGYLYRQTGSITPSIILHFLLNGFSMFWFTLEQLLNSII